MSWILSGPGGAAVARAVEAETLGNDAITLKLLLDAGATHGAFSTHQVLMRGGVDGAVPHRHQRSSELFYVLGGSVDILAGDEVLTATQGDLVVVPPDLPHAFAATAGQDGELIAIIAPGVDRFEYFRHLGRVAAGQAPWESLHEMEEQYDSYAVQSEAWQRVRGAR